MNEQQPSGNNRMNRYRSILRPIIVVSLICLTILYLVSSDFSKAFFTALFAIFFFIIKGTDDTTGQGVRGYTILLESSMRKVDRPEAVLHRTILRMIEQGHPSREEILDILYYFMDQDDEVGKEAKRLWDELNSEDTVISN